MTTRTPLWICKICGLEIKSKYQLLQHSRVKCFKGYIKNPVVLSLNEELKGGIA